MRHFVSKRSYRMDTTHELVTLDLRIVIQLGLGDKMPCLSDAASAMSPGCGMPLSMVLHAPRTRSA